MDSIAIAHDKLDTNGGAERVAYQLARTLDAPIYAMHVDPSVVPNDIDAIDISNRLGSHIMNTHHLLEDAYQMLAWQHVPELYRYDTIIQNKTNPYWFVPKDEQTIIRYCHSTPRNLYDQFHRRGGNILGDTLKTLQRVLYQHVIPYADQWITNSDLVQRRLTHYYNVPSHQTAVVYPPVHVDAASPTHAETQDYIFRIGRLSVNKRIDLLLKVADQTDQQIVVAGDGAYSHRLQDAPRNVEYLGWISEDEKWRRYSEARATLFLGENEDFGITPIEALASGTPVIGVDEGFTKHQLKDGKNGVLVDPTARDVTAGIQRIVNKGVAWSPEELAVYADQFSRDRFAAAITEVIAHAREQTSVKPGIREPTRAKQIQ